MKKVLIVHNGSELYGGSKSLLSIVKVLKGNNLDVNVILPEDGKLVKELTREKVIVTIIPSIPSISVQSLMNFSRIVLFVRKFIVSIKKIIQTIKIISPDIIHINVSTLPSAALAAKLTKTKLIWHVREIYDGNQRYLWCIYQIFIFVLSNVIIVNSTATKKQFMKYFHRKIFLLHNSFEISPKNNLPTIDQVQKFKLKFNIHSDYCIGMVGRINLNRKGQEIFVKAAKIVKERFPNSKFIIIGDPYPGKDYYLNELKLLIKNNNLKNYVLLLGEIKNIILAYNLFDIVVIPSTRPESFGNVALEAMNSFKPLICSNIGGIKDQIINNKNGFLFENKDFKGLANKIEILLSDNNLRKNYGEAGRKILEEKFNFNNFNLELINIYNII